MDNGADNLFEWDIGRKVKRAFYQNDEGRRTRKREVEKNPEGKLSLAVSHSHT